MTNFLNPLDGIKMTINKNPVNLRICDPDRPYDKNYQEAMFGS